MNQNHIGLGRKLTQESLTETHVAIKINESCVLLSVVVEIKPQTGINARPCETSSGTNMICSGGPKITVPFDFAQASPTPRLPLHFFLSAKNERRRAARSSLSNHNLRQHHWRASMRNPVPTIAMMTSIVLTGQWAPSRGGEINFPPTQQIEIPKADITYVQQHGPDFAAAYQLLIAAPMHCYDYGPATAAPAQAGGPAGLVGHGAVRCPLPAVRGRVLRPAVPGRRRRCGPAGGIGAAIASA